jgi:hypothetical protein
MTSRNYCTALSLNNAAVTLLEEASFDLAVGTLEEAVSIMRRLHNPGTSRGPAKDQEPHQDDSQCPIDTEQRCALEERMEKIHKRFGNFRSTSPALSSAEIRMRPITFCNEQDYALVRTSKAPFCNPIRFCYQNEERDYSYDTAAVLYNAGLAYYGASKGATKLAEKRKRQMSAMKFFQFAFASLKNQGQGQQLDASNRILKMRRNLHCALAILRAMSHLAEEHESGQLLLPVDSIKSKLKRLLTTIEELDRLGAFGGHGPIMVAPAA